MNKILKQAVGIDMAKDKFEYVSQSLIVNKGHYQVYKEVQQQ